MHSYKREQQLARQRRDPHIVVLYRNFEEVDHFSIPVTDPRFIKHPDIAEMAYSRALKRNIEWDELAVQHFQHVVFCDPQGQIVSGLDRMMPSCKLAV